MVIYPLRGPFSSVARYNVLIFSTSASLQKSHTRRKFALIGKENPPGQLMAIFPFVELELHRAPQLPISQIP